MDRRQQNYILAKIAQGVSPHDAVIQYQLDKQLDAIIKAVAKDSNLT